jgi:hypothetical protein
MSLETQISVFVKNKVGTLNQLCSALSEASINIRALSTADEVDWAIVGLIVDDTARTKEILGNYHLNFGESTVLTITMENKPGQLARLTKKLSEQNINIVYASMTAEGERSLLVLMTTDNKRANEILD